MRIKPPTYIIYCLIIHKCKVRETEDILLLQCIIYSLTFNLAACTLTGRELDMSHQYNILAFPFIWYTAVGLIVYCLFFWSAD